MGRFGFPLCLAALFLAFSVNAQGPVNLNFKGSAPGEELEGWHWIREPDYTISAKDDCPIPHSRCAMVRYGSGPNPRDFGYIMQTFPATTLRGKQVRCRAWLRVDNASVSRAQLFVRVDRPDGVVGFANYSHDDPVRSSGWTVREIVGTIDADAVNVTIGLMLGGRGSAYIADVEFETIRN
jgi:hypothetical protein